MGQRRAASLAFLLPIHLSRSYCGLKTLVLDDPVQHIDDYRALHLVEVLTAIRRDHRQIICTVEDTVLAELMARRLRSQGEDVGEVIRLGYEAGVGGASCRASDDSAPRISHPRGLAEDGSLVVGLIES